MEGKGTARFDTRRFRPELTPTWLAMATLLAGQRPPELGDRCRVAYLGGGHTFTAAVVAAVHPEIEVLWWDPDVRAVESARRIRDRAALTNLRVHEHPEVPRGLGGPSADVVVLDGLLDSIDDATRARVFDLLATDVRPGGIVCAGYRTTVGWSELEPAHRLIVHLVAKNPRSLDEAVPEVKRTMRHLRDGRTGYLNARPYVASWLDEVFDLPHEEFAEHLVRRPLRPFSHAWLASTLAPLGFEHVGPAAAEDLPEPDVNSEVAAIIADAASPAVSEAFTDLALRRSHRSDVFRLGEAALSTRERGRSVGSLEVVGLPGLASVVGRASKRLPTAPIRRALIEGPLKVSELHRDRSECEPLLRRMLADGLLHPVADHRPDTEHPVGATRLSSLLSGSPTPKHQRVRLAMALGSALPAKTDADTDTDPEQFTALEVL